MMKRSILIIAAASMMCAPCVSFASALSAEHAGFTAASDDLYLVENELTATKAAQYASGLHITSFKVTDNRVEPYRPLVVASCNTGYVADKPVAGKSEDNRLADAVANDGDDGLISYPDQWSRKGVYINDDGLVASCYAPRSSNDYATPGRPNNDGAELTAMNDATLWEPLSPD